jgi:tetratricopeptide (TPR) repeat protein
LAVMDWRNVRLAVLAALLAACGGFGAAANPGGAAGAAAGAGAAPRPEALSLLGQPLFPPAPAPDVRARLERELAGARAAYEADPRDADAIIWLGRRLAYLGQYGAAIGVFTEGIEKHPQDARMYRHRGHRYITTRQFNRAVADLQRATELIRGRPDEVEPDGAPNSSNIPVSTLHSNIWYHLALGHYLRHDFESALPAWQQALAASDNDDMVVASADWLYMTLRRLGRNDEAAAVLQRISPDMRILENDSYHRRLLMYRGLIAPDSLLQADTQDAVQVATYGYGVANWYLYNGDRRAAEALFRRILEGRNWAAFGYIAAEAELARVGREDAPPPPRHDTPPEPRSGPCC